ncbi:uncharacterized protein [Panulirus ornatus]|uniref:uncharacterized protein n=1 Tax=Panulirus ornatus TaxID=150431 RepID=UPI003A87FF1A
MSLSEAAAALDRLLWGHSQEALPRGAGPNVPPYAPPPVAQENLLPALLPRTHTPQAQGPLSSTPVASPDDAPRTSALLPWEALTHPAAEDLPFPVSPLQASPIPPPPPSDSWLALSDPPQHSKSCRRSPEDQCPSRRRSSSNSSSSSSSSSSGDQGPGGEDDDDDDGSPTTPTGSFTPLDPEKYKTELCRSYQVHGFCRYGARCNYAHGLRQLRGASHHGKYKTRNCQSYHQTGFCRYGARCSFIHDPEEGVLKCSIANKEVLEALYYFPTYEEASRTASITWRLQEAGSPHTQELHLIANNRPLEDEPGHVASPRASPRGFLDAGDFFLGGSRLWAYNPSSPLGDDGSCLVTHDGKDSVTPLGSHGRGVASGMSPQLTTHPAGSSVGQRRPGWDASLEGKERFVAQMDPLSRQLQQKVSGGVAAAARASLFPMKSRRRLSWWDVAPADFDPLGGKGCGRKPRQRVPGPAEAGCGSQYPAEGAAVLGHAVERRHRRRPRP